MAAIVGVRALHVGQPPERIGPRRVGRDLPAFTSIETFQTEVEPIEATEKLAEFLPGILAPVYDHPGRAVVLIDPAVYRRSLRVEPVLLSARDPSRNSPTDSADEASFLLSPSFDCLDGAARDSPAPASTSRAGGCRYRCNAGAREWQGALRSTIVESHSEHFLNRLQRRVAEGEVPPEHLAVYFARRAGSKTDLEPLRLNEFGEIENWPEHFFGDEMADIAARTMAAMKRKKELQSEPGG